MDWDSEKIAVAVLVVAVTIWGGWDSIKNIAEGRMSLSPIKLQIERLSTHTQTPTIDAAKSALQLLLNDKEIKEKEAQLKFWIKLAFSVVFGVAALFVVLSKKYDDKIQGWAISVLTLIGGVW